MGYVVLHFCNFLVLKFIYISEQKAHNIELASDSSGAVEFKIERKKMIMKKTKLIAAVTISAVLTACSPKQAASPVTGSETGIQAAETTAAGYEEGDPENYAESLALQNLEEVYEDNFAVDTKVAAAFADKIKGAVADQDIEALADLTEFPVYVGIAEGRVEDREALITLGPENVFTPGLMESVAGADTSDLSPSMAGFTISKDGKSNIIFGVVEGKLAIRGINID